MRAALPLSLACAVLVACGTPPELPPEDAMKVSFAGLEEGGALADTRDAWGQAILRVGIANAFVGLGLAAPVLTYGAAMSQHPSEEGDGWVWRYPVKHALVDATATLTAMPDGNGWTWEMRIHGRVGVAMLSHFLWYEGRSEGDAGHWQFYDQNGKTIRLDWRHTAPLDREATFTNVSGTADDGDLLSYVVSGEDASVTYDLGGEVAAHIEWNLRTRAGSIVASDWSGHAGEQACWNRDLVDVACEAP